jgi:hypothetical protein
MEQELLRSPSGSKFPNSLRTRRTANDEQALPDFAAQDPVAAGLALPLQADGCGPAGSPRPTRIASDGRGVYEDVAGPVYGLIGPCDAFAQVNDHSCLIARLLCRGPAHAR